MNKKGQELNLLGQGVLFVILFFVGGIIEILSLPEFPGRFYVSGLIFAPFDWAWEILSFIGIIMVKNE